MKGWEAAELMKLQILLRLRKEPCPTQGCHLTLSVIDSLLRGEPYFYNPTKKYKLLAHRRSKKPTNSLPPQNPPKNFSE